MRYKQFTENPTTFRLVIEAIYVIGYTLIKGALFLLISSLDFYGVVSILEYGKNFCVTIVEHGAPEALIHILAFSAGLLILLLAGLVFVVASWLVLPSIIDNIADYFKRC